MDLAGPVTGQPMLGTAPTDTGSAPGAVDRQPAPRQIDRCQVIDEPGRYVVTQDIVNSIEDACLVIAADDVHLDGNGYRVDGIDRADTVGVELRRDATDGLRNVTVTGLTVTDWAVGIGETGPAGDGSIVDARIADNTVRGNTAGVLASGGAGGGIQLHGLSESTVVGNELRDNAAGIGIREFGSDVDVSDNVVHGNDGNGIVLFEGGPDARVAANDVRDNRGVGIDLANEVDGATVSDNDVVGNDDGGIAIGTSMDVAVVGNRVTDNGHHGIALLDVASFGDPGTQVSDNAVLDNGGSGIVMSASAGTVADNRVVGNAGWALHLDEMFGSASRVVVRNLSTETAALSFDDGRNIAVRPADGPPDDPDGWETLDGYLEIDTTAADGEVQLEVGYPEDAVTDRGIEESSLRLWRFDGEWALAADPNDVDTTRNVVVGHVIGPGTVVIAGQANSTSAADDPPDDAPDGTPTSTPTPTPTPDGQSADEPPEGPANESTTPTPTPEETATPDTAGSSDDTPTETATDTRAQGTTGSDGASEPAEEPSRTEGSPGSERMDDPYQPGSLPGGLGPDIGLFILLGIASLTGLFVYRTG